MAQTTTARYQTKCHECGLMIARGEEIEPGYRSFRHADCTRASIRRQITERVSSGASPSEIWAWLNRSPHLTMDQKIDAIFYANRTA